MVPRTNSSRTVVTPVPGARLTVPAVRSSGGTTGTPVLNEPTGAKVLGPDSLIAMSCGYACAMPFTRVTALSLCGLRENPTRITTDSVGRYAQPSRGVKRSFWTLMLHTCAFEPA